MKAELQPVSFKTDNKIKEGKGNGQLPHMFLGMMRNMVSVKPKGYLSDRFARNPPLIPSAQFFEVSYRVSVIRIRPRSACSCSPVQRNRAVSIFLLC